MEQREPNTEEEIDVLSCTVRSVIYSNEENGYAVLSVTDTDGTEQKMTGTFPYAWPGESITAYGHWASACRRRRRSPKSTGVSSA